MELFVAFVVGCVFAAALLLTPTLLAFGALVLGWYFTRRHAQLSMSVLAQTAVDYRQQAMNLMHEVAHLGGPPCAGNHFPNGEGDDDEEGCRS